MLFTQLFTPQLIDENKGITHIQWQLKSWKLFKSFIFFWDTYLLFGDPIIETLQIFYWYSMHIEIFATLEANWSIQKNKKKKKLRNAFVKLSSWDKSKITDWEWANYGINHLGNYTFSFPFSKGLSFLVATKPWGMVSIMLIKSVILEPSAIPDRG